MSIFGKMFRRGGPRDPGDGDGDGQGHEEQGEAPRQVQTPVVVDDLSGRALEPEETTMTSYPPTDVREMVADEPPDEEPPPGASSPVTGADARTARAAAAASASSSSRLQSFALPPGVVAQPPRPRRASQQQSAGNGRGSQRKPPSPTGPHGPATDPRAPQAPMAATPSRPNPAPQTPMAATPSRPNPAPSALGSSPGAPTAPSMSLPPLRGGLPRASTHQSSRAAAAAAQQPPAAARNPIPPRASGVITSAAPPPAQPAPQQAPQPAPHQAPQPSSPQHPRARRASPLPADATPLASAAATPTSISESVSREIELRGRPKPSTVEIGDILEELDLVTGSAPGSHAVEIGAGDPAEATPVAGTGERATTQREPEMATGDRDALRELFNELAGHHLAQLRDLMIEVRLGSALSEWIEMSEPAVRSVRGMAEQLEMTELCVALDRLLGELGGARAKGGAISGARRDALLAAYAPLQELVPGALEVEAERDRREPVIVHSLLRQVEGVEKVAIDRLVAAQLVSIAALSTARPDELSAVTGLPRELAERLIARFRDYRAQSGVVASPDPMAELRLLGVLCASLRQQNRDFDDAAAQWSDDSKERKRLLRRERAETLLRIHVSLARLGQVDQLVELDKLSFRRKADFVEAYLKAARATRAKTALTGPGQ